MSLKEFTAQVKARLDEFPNNKHFTLERVEAIKLLAVVAELERALRAINKSGKMFASATEKSMVDKAREALKRADGIAGEL